MTVESSMKRWLIFSLRRRSAMMWSCTGPPADADADEDAAVPPPPPVPWDAVVAASIPPARLPAAGVLGPPLTAAGLANEASVVCAEAALKFQLMGLLVLARAVCGDHPAPAGRVASWSMAAALGLSQELAVQLLLPRCWSTCTVRSRRPPPAAVDWRRSACSEGKAAGPAPALLPAPAPAPEPPVPPYVGGATALYCCCCCWSSEFIAHCMKSSMALNYRSILIAPPCKKRQITSHGSLALLD
jgi:hypothetical protein